MAKESPPPSGQSDADSDDRLDSWKDVASYLRRDVSTVQRWEKREGMPVHRHVHDKLGTVYAFRSELDVWWRGRMAQQEAQEPLAAPASAVPERREGRRRMALIGALAGGLAIILAFALALRQIVSGPGDAAAPAPPSRSGLTGPGAVNSKAYDLLMRARYLSVRTTDADSQSAIALLEQAIQVDSAYAPAYAELASAYVIRLAYVTPDETRELEQKAFSAAEKALSLDPNLPEAYLARGDLLWTHAHRFAHDRAVQEFRRALTLNPDSDQAHRRLARVYVHVGFFEEALHHAATALAINPSNGQALNSRAQALLWMGKEEEALAILLNIPGPVLPELVEANTVFALLRLDRPEEARAYLQRAARKYPQDPNGNLQGVEAMVVADTDPGRAHELIEGIRQRKAANPSHHAAFFAACALARMRRAREAVEWLREAAATGFPCYALFAHDPDLALLRSDPLFRAFMAELQKTSASLRRTLFPA